jgi:uncharacterized protein (DUF362 family)
MESISQIPVCLDRCYSYDQHVLQPLLQKHFDILNIPLNFSNKRVLLKPNLISASAPALSCSNPKFVAAVAACFLARGAKVLIGDSPAFGSAFQVLKRQGFVKALSGYDVEFTEFRTSVVKKLDCGLSVTVAGEALDCDYFVNLPRIKAHEQMGLTMAIKNVFGVILGARKAWLHMRHGETHHGFAEMILDVHKVLPLAMVIADGIEVMNKRGPMKGSSLLLGCLAVAENFVALDRAMLDVLEVEKERIPLAVAAEKQALPGAVIQDICFPLLVPGAFAGAGFRVPQKLSPARFQILQYARSSIRRVISG